MPWRGRVLPAWACTAVGVAALLAAVDERGVGAVLASVGRGDLPGLAAAGGRVAALFGVRAAATFAQDCLLWAAALEAAEVRRQPAGVSAETPPALS